VVYAVRARARLGEGDYEAAVRYARLARIWCWVSLAVAVVVVVILVNEACRAGTGTTMTVGFVLEAVFQSG
jgi:t-SNARE complex subunit (syntaxin)